jgi:hypothetical protein
MELLEVEVGDDEDGGDGAAIGDRPARLFRWLAPDETEPSTAVVAAFVFLVDSTILVRFI